MAVEFNVDLPTRYTYDDSLSWEDNLRLIDAYIMKLHSSLEDNLRILFSRAAIALEDGTEDNLITIDEDGGIQDSGVDISIDGTLGDNADTSVPTEQAVKTYVDANAGIADLIEDTTPQLGGNLDMNGKNIGGNSETQLDDAVAKKHTQGSDTTLGAQAGNLDMNTNKIVGVVDPTSNQEVATKKYVDDNAGASLSNVIFAWSSVYSNSTINAKWMVDSSDSLMSSPEVNGQWAGLLFTASTFNEGLHFRFLKLAGISTITIHIFVATHSAANGEIKVDIGAASGTKTTIVTSTTAAWESSPQTVDVSGLSDGTSYAGTISGRVTGGAGKDMVLYAITLIAS